MTQASEPFRPDWIINKCAHVRIRRRTSERVHGMKLAFIFTSSSHEFKRPVIQSHCLIFDSKTSLREKNTSDSRCLKNEITMESRINKQWLEEWRNSRWGRGASLDSLASRPIDFSDLEASLVVSEIRVRNLITNRDWIISCKKGWDTEADQSKMNWQLLVLIKFLSNDRLGDRARSGLDVS